MVYWSMGNDLRGADKLYIKRGSLVLDDFFFFSLYSFSCIEKQRMNLVLVMPCFLETNVECFVLSLMSQYCIHYHLLLTCLLQVMPYLAFLSRFL